MVHPRGQYSNFVTVCNIIYIEDGVPILLGPPLPGGCHHFFLSHKAVSISILRNCLRYAVVASIHFYLIVTDSIFIALFYRKVKEAVPPGAECGGN